MWVINQIWIFKIFNKIDECFIAPHLAFAHIFQLWRCGQYGMHGSIMNVPSNLKLIQNVLPWMPYDDSSISNFSKGKLEYKFIYISSYVCPNMVMKTFKKIINFFYIQMQMFQ